MGEANTFSSQMPCQPHGLKQALTLKDTGTEGLNISHICLQTAQHIASKRLDHISARQVLNVPGQTPSDLSKTLEVDGFETVTSVHETSGVGLCWARGGRWLTSMQKRVAQSFLGITQGTNPLKLNKNTFMC